MIEKIYLIDGVQVTKRIWESRKIFGEYAGARFEISEVRRERKGKGVPQRARP